MSNIPTAEQLLSNNIDGLKDALKNDDLYYFYRGVICEFAKSFTEKHVTEALKQANEKVRYIRIGSNVSINESSILNAYPLDNIK